MKYFFIYPHDVNIEPLILWHIDPISGHRKVRARYEALLCPECGKIDECKALDLGIDEEVTIPRVSRDFFGSWDQLILVSDKMKTVLESFPDSNVGFYPLRHSDFIVAMPRRVFYPVLNDSAFEIHGKCEKCGRFRDVVWGSGRPVINGSFSVGVFQLENPCVGMMPAWIVSEPVAKAIKEKKLKGIFFDRKEVSCLPDAPPRTG